MQQSIFKKHVIFDTEARSRVGAGISIAVKAVCATLGPKGRHVVIDDTILNPVITKDGYTVAASLNMQDTFENLGVKLIREAAFKTNSESGDGTSTATALAGAIFTNGLKAISRAESPANPVALKYGIDAAVAAINEKISAYARPVQTNEEIRRVAIISGNNHELVGDVMLQAIELVGKENPIVLDRAANSITRVERVSGMAYDICGFVSGYFANTRAAACEFKNCLIVVLGDRLQALESIGRLMQENFEGNTPRPMVIMAPDFSDAAIQKALSLRVQHSVELCLVKAPDHGDRAIENLRDIAAVTGATFISRMTGIDLEKVTVADCGVAAQFYADKSKTLITGTAEVDEVAIAQRVTLAKQELDNAKSPYEQRKAKDRMSRLSGGMAVIYVGGNSETEYTELRDRFEDAIMATKAAISDGIMEGGSYPLLQVTHELASSLQLATEHGKDFTEGYCLVLESCKEPILIMLANAGYSREAALEILNTEIVGKKRGLNVATMQYCDLFESGIIEPVRITKSALKNAAAVSGMILTMEVAIVEVVDTATQAMIPGRNS